MSNVYWEWLCSLYKSREKTTIDPYLWRCPCGHTWRFNRLQLLWMFLHEDYVHTCPQCLRKSRYRMITHTVRETDTEEIRRYNRGLE